MTSSEPLEIARPAVASSPPRPAGGLRARKKARTRSAIRAEAIRMFTEQGYAATTVEQIAEAADISPSTFFRYFPTKEAVLLTDEYDPVFFETFRSQPPAMSVIRAFRNANQVMFAQVGPQAQEQEWSRFALLKSAPELRAALFNQYALSLVQIAELIGERIGRPGDDVRVRTLAGALVGVSLSVTLELMESDHPEVDLSQVAARLDTAMELLEAGLPLFD